MSFLDDLISQAGQVAQQVLQSKPAQFLRENPSPFSYAINKLPWNVSTSTPGSNIINPALQTAKALPYLPSAIGQTMSRSVGSNVQAAQAVGGAVAQSFLPRAQSYAYYQTAYPWQQSMAERGQQQEAARQTTATQQATIARSILERNPSTTNREKLLGIINESSGKTYEQFTPSEFQRTPGQLVGEALETALDVGTAGSLPGGIKSVMTKIPKLARFITGGAALGAGYGTAAALEEKLDAQEAGKTIGLYTVGGATIGAALFGAGAITNKLITQKKIYKALADAGQGIGKTADDMARLSSQTYSYKGAQDALDDVALELQTMYGDAAEGTLKKLSQLDVQKMKGWDDLSKKAIGVTDNSKFSDAILRHITTRRVYTTDPEMLAVLVDNYGVDLNIPQNQTTEDGLRNIMKPVSDAVMDLVPGKVPDAISTTADFGAAKAGKAIAEPVFGGFRNLSTKILEKLKGRSTVSKEFIYNLTNSGDIKQTERDIIRQVLDSEPDKVNVRSFAKKVQNELLPLKVQSSDLYEGKHGIQSRLVEEGSFTPKYEAVALPDELRGKVASYKENLYESPIATSAGDVHFNYQTKNYFGHTRVEDMADNQTRRVIEVQSDLYQKGRLAGESYSESIELSKLQQYNDPTAHFRMIREEVKQSAKDGKTKLQFPTGETAMNIEGLGGRIYWQHETGINRGKLAKPETLKVGETLMSGDVIHNENIWVITDVLGDGKFKAVPKNIADDVSGSIESVKESFSDWIEQFDISGKVDTNNPIYKFYEKEVGKYLKNKYNAKSVVDEQGVKWWEVAIDKTMKAKPIEAFGASAGFERDEEGNITYNPYKGALGVVAMGTLKGKPELFERIAKGFNRSEGGDALLKRIVEEVPFEKATITWDETMKAAQSIGLDPAALSKKSASQLSRPEVLAIKDIVATNMDFITTAEQKLQSGTLKPSEAEALQRQVSTAMEQNLDLTDKFLERSSEAGRFLNSLKITANATLDPVTWLAKAQKIRGEKLTDEMHSTIQELIANKDRTGLVDYVSQLRQSKPGEKLVNLWKVGLLTAFRTHEVNFLGNLGMATIETLKDLPATMIDWAASGVTGKRTKAIGLDKLFASFKGVYEGFGKAKRIAKTGVDPDQLMALNDIPKQVVYKHKLFNIYTQAVYRLLGATDAVFFQKQQQRILMEGALVRARQQLKNQEITADQVKATVKELFTNPTDDMVSNAIDSARYTTFKGDNKMADIASYIKRKVPVGGEIIIPFSRTPSNIVKAVMDYSPMGFLTTLAKQVKGGFDQRLFAEGIARAVTGSSIIALGSALASKGLLRGTGSETEGTRNVANIARQLDTAVKIGDNWYQINRFSPVGNLLIMGADFYTAYKDAATTATSTGDKLVKTAGQALFSTAKQATDQPMLQGVSRSLRAITEPKRFGASFLENLVGGVIPNIISDVRKGLDPRLLDPQTAGQQIQGDIPGLSKDISAKQTIFGQDRMTMDKEKGLPARLFNSLFNPVIASKETKNPVIQEMVRINYESPIPTKKTLTFEGIEGELALSEKRQREYTKVTGGWYYQFSKQLMATPAWEQLSDEEKTEAFDQAYRAAGKIGTLYLQTEWLKSKMQLNTPNQQ